MKSIVVLAEVGWSIGRVHHDVAFYLSGHYEFKFYNIFGFLLADFLKDFHKADLCLTTVGWFDTVMGTCKLSQADLRKMVLVCHGHCEIKNHKWSPYITYGAVSDVLLPFMATRLHIVPNGVNSSFFDRKMHTGQLKVLGWCGELRNVAKRSDMVFEIARRLKMPVSIAETLTLENLKDWYHSVDVLLVTSGPGPHIETGPLPPFEAIVSGVVVIGTNVGNFRKVPGPKFETVEDAVQILDELRTKPDTVCEIAQEQYKWVMENWTYRTHAESWKTMFDAACALKHTVFGSQQE